MLKNNEEALLLIADRRSPEKSSVSGLAYRVKAVKQC